MSTFKITLNETVYSGVLKTEYVPASEFIVLGSTDSGQCTESIAGDLDDVKSGDLILIQDNSVVARYKESRWLDIKLVPGKENGNI